MRYLEILRRELTEPILLHRHLDLYLEKYLQCAYPGLWITVRKPEEYPNECIELVARIPDEFKTHAEFAVWYEDKVLPYVKKHKEYMKHVVSCEKYDQGISTIYEKPKGFFVIEYPGGNSPVPYWVTNDDKLFHLLKEIEREVNDVH